MHWFKMHNDARTDRKLASLSDAEFRVWFNLLCMASDSTERGKVIYEDIELLAIEVGGGDTELVQRTVERLVKLRIVQDCDGEILFISWESRQYEKPSDAPEETRKRKAEQRKREKEIRQNSDSGNMSRPVTPCHATEQIQNRTDTEQTDPPTPRVDSSAPANGVVSRSSDKKQRVEEALQRYPHWKPKLDQLVEEARHSADGVRNEWSLRLWWIEEWQRYPDKAPLLPPPRGQPARARGPRPPDPLDVALSAAMRENP